MPFNVGDRVLVDLRGKEAHINVEFLTQTEWPGKVVAKPGGVVYNVKLDGSFTAIDTLTYLRESDLRPLKGEGPERLAVEYRQRVVEWKEAIDALTRALDEYAPPSGVTSHEQVIGNITSLKDIDQVIDRCTGSLARLQEAYHRLVQG